VPNVAQSHRIVALAAFWHSNTALECDVNPSTYM